MREDEGPLISKAPLICMPIKDRSFFIVLILTLTVGVLFRLLLTQNGSFIFHMDSARDFIDVREMVELKKPRLIGPTSAIDGFYNGPAWYYLLAIPYILSGGNPYSAIIMEIIFWAIGGYFLLKLVQGYGLFSMVVAGSLWVSSNYIVLLTSYSFNPNPVALLTPLFVYLLMHSIETNKSKDWFVTFFLGGIFFNFEMNAGVFVPLIIFASLILSNNLKLSKRKEFWLGTSGFIICLLPQLLFDLRHNFIMANSVIKYIAENPSGSGFNPSYRFSLITETFYNGLVATFFNIKWLVNILVISLIALVIKTQKNKLAQDPLLGTSLSLIIVPFLGYIFIPVAVNPWHLGLIVVSGIILSSWVIYHSPKFLSLILASVIFILSLNNIVHFFQFDYGKRNQDPSLLANEIDAIDYVYKKSNGANFKVYSYLPSVYDFPYQYLFWWYGKKQYGYLPSEYTYAPNKPPYVPSQQFFQNNISKKESDLVFLIVQPQDEKLKDLWYNHFKNYTLLEKQPIGPLIVETRIDP